MDACATYKLITSRYQKREKYEKSNYMGKRVIKHKD